MVIKLSDIDKTKTTKKIKAIKASLIGVGFRLRRLNVSER